MKTGKWQGRIKLQKVSKIAIAIALILLTVFAGFTIYGNKVGGFIIDVDNNEVSLALSEYENLDSLTTRISVPGMNDQKDATLTDIPSDITVGMGSKNDRERKLYLAFSFYLVNESDFAVDYTMTMTIIDETLGTGNAIRVMIVENADSYGDIYARAEQSEFAAAQLKERSGYELKTFVSDVRVLEKPVSNFEAKGKIKYTVVIWLEGWDEECTNAIKGGKIKMRMTFTGYKAQEE